jgi:hypothetical protein
MYTSEEINRAIDHRRRARRAHRRRRRAAGAMMQFAVRATSQRRDHPKPRTFQDGGPVGQGTPTLQGWIRRELQLLSVAIAKEVDQAEATRRIGIMQEILDHYLALDEDDRE